MSKVCIFNFLRDMGFLVTWNPPLQAPGLVARAAFKGGTKIGLFTPPGGQTGSQGEKPVPGQI